MIKTRRVVQRKRHHFVIHQSKTKRLVLFWNQNQTVASFSYIWAVYCHSIHGKIICIGICNKYIIIFAYLTSFKRQRYYLIIKLQRTPLYKMQYVVLMSYLNVKLPKCSTSCYRYTIPIMINRQLDMIMRVCIYYTYARNEDPTKIVWYKQSQWVYYMQWHITFAYKKIMVRYICFSRLCHGSSF